MTEQKPHHGSGRWPGSAAAGTTRAGGVPGWRGGFLEPRAWGQAGTGPLGRRAACGRWSHKDAVTLEVLPRHRHREKCPSLSLLLPSSSQLCLLLAECDQGQAAKDPGKCGLLGLSFPDTDQSKGRGGEDRQKSKRPAHGLLHSTCVCTCVHTHPCTQGFPQDKSILGRQCTYPQGVNSMRGMSRGASSWHL